MHICNRLLIDIATLSVVAVFSTPSRAYNRLTHPAKSPPRGCERPALLPTSPQVEQHGSSFQHA